tara:strand:- start:418 stop:615 length:198 start_codon:yes stop_codon:yes gene_type:complete
VEGMGVQVIMESATKEQISIEANRIMMELADTMPPEEFYFVEAILMSFIKEDEYIEYETYKEVNS